MSSTTQINETTRSRRLPGLGAVEQYSPMFRADVEHGKRVQTRCEPRLPINQGGDSSSTLIAVSPSMLKFIERAKKAAASNASILIQGETGSGKECIAQMLHRESARVGKAFVARNCSAIPANLFESEMFGHKRGAFTGADHERHGAFVEADQGTLFLDEIADLEFSLQTKLLRAIQEMIIHPVGSDRDVQASPRIVCASNKDLRECIAAKTFREDLFYRVATITLNVPPLRERREDILPLARHFLNSESKASHTLSPAAERALVAYNWPGNVRELRALIDQALIFTERKEIQPEELNIPSVSNLPDERSDSLRDVEMRHILSVMKKCYQNKTDAARILKIARSTLLLKLQAYQNQTYAGRMSRVTVAGDEASDVGGV